MDKNLERYEIVKELQKLYSLREDLKKWLEYKWVTIDEYRIMEDMIDRHINLLKSHLRDILLGERRE